MQSHTKLEVSVGAFVIAGVAALAYLSLSLGGVEVGHSRYEVHARFSSVGDLRRGGAVKLAGVNVGEVSQIALIDYTADVVLSVDRTLRLPKDSIASIQTSGLLGDAYVSLSPGGASENLLPGGAIRQTEPAISLTELLAKYAFGSIEGDGAQRAPSRSREPSPSPTDLLQ